MLALAGGALGVLLSNWALVGLQALGTDLPRVENAVIDSRVLGWAVGISILSGILFGLIPALKISKPNLSSAIREGGNRSGVARSVARMRNGMVVAEIAISLVLLAGAGLLVRSFANLTNVDV